MESLLHTFETYVSIRLHTFETYVRGKLAKLEE